MDPNNNPTPNTESNLPPDPNLGMTPEQPVAGNPEAGAEVAAGVEAAAQPVIDPVMTNPTPVNPVINPGGNMGETPMPVNPVFQPTRPDGLSEMDPILQPEAPTPPDPIEEELKAPMKAAAPAPGSIGSAISGPTEGGAEASAPTTPAADNPFVNNEPTQTPSVSFSDPSMQQTNVDAKKKDNKKTLIILIAVAAMVVIALVAILIVQLVNNPSSSDSGSTATNNPTVLDDDEDEEGGDEGGALTNGTLSCTRNMNEAEIAKVNDASTGTISISAQFSDGLLDRISLVESVVYDDEDATNNEPVEMGVHEAVADELTPASGLNYFLPQTEDGELDLSLDAIQANYEDLDFTCEVL